MKMLLAIQPFIFHKHDPFIIYTFFRIPNTALDSGEISYLETKENGKKIMTNFVISLSSFLST